MMRVVGTNRLLTRSALGFVLVLVVLAAAMWGMTVAVPDGEPRTNPIAVPDLPSESPRPGVGSDRMDAGQETVRSAVVPRSRMSIEPSSEDVASPAPAHLREAAVRWLPPEYHSDGGMLGAAKVLDDLHDEDRAKSWIQSGDVDFARMLRGMGVDGDSAVVDELRAIDAPFARDIERTQLEIMKSAMAEAIATVVTGADIEYEPPPVTPEDPWGRIEESAELQDRLLKEACPEFRIEDLSVVKIGGSKVGAGRLIPLNRRDHRAYFAARDELARIKRVRRDAWRSVLERGGR